MTISYGFYNSVSGDRVYDAIQMSRIFDGIILDGVYAALGDYFLVTENTTPDMDVLVGSGRAWFNHTWTYNDADITITVPTASPLLPRIDVVYLEVNEDTAVRANKIDILEGTPASSPVAPTLTNTTTVHQYPLAHIYVGVSVTSITQANITNKVGTAETPFVTCPLTYIETDDMLAEWEAQWLDWFDAIKDQLSTEAETNLQAQIWDLAGVASGAPPYADDMVSLAAHDHSGAHPQIPSGGLENGAVIAGKIATGGVSAAAQIASGIVDYTKLDDNIPFMLHRNGGNATQWDEHGTNQYDPGKFKIMCGSIQDVVSGATEGTVTVSYYGNGFTARPIVLIMPYDTDHLTVSVYNPSNLMFVVDWKYVGPYSGVSNPVFHWIAIGPTS